MTALRRLGVEDAGAAYPILAQALSSMWTYDALLIEMARASSICLGLESAEGGLAGVSISRFLPGEEAEILLVAIVPELRRRGLGRELLAKTVEEVSRGGARRVFLVVRESNAPARKLYEGAGFRVLRISRRAYRDPTEDGVEMGRPLPPAGGGGEA